MSDPARMKDHGTGLEQELWRSAFDDGPRTEAWERLEEAMANEAPRIGATRDDGQAGFRGRRRRGGAVARYAMVMAAAAAVLIAGAAAARALSIWPSSRSDSKEERSPRSEGSGVAAGSSKPIASAVSPSTARGVDPGDAEVAMQGPWPLNEIGAPASSVAQDWATSAKTFIELVRASNRVGPDHSMGVEGNWYSDGDGVSCPSVDPCGENGCCMLGHTRKDPTFKAWGCVVGLELQAPTEGWAHEKHPYAGPAKGFDVQIDGASAGVPLRILFTQEAYPVSTVSPMVEIPGPGRFRVRFDDAAYPAWCATNPQCGAAPGQTANSSSTYDFELQIVGGLADADFDVCVTSLSPFE